MKNEKEPSEILSDFLNYIDKCRHDYQTAHDAVGMEDKRLQDLLHAVEFTDNKYDMHNEALRLWESRRIRRKNKDISILYKEVAQYFQSAQGQKFLNELRQLLGRQRKQEEYLAGNREYRNRMHGR